MKRLAVAALLCVGAAAQQRLVPLDESSYAKLIAAQKGHVVVADFWATWCDPCRAEMPQLVRLAEQLRSRGLKLITISADEPEAEAGALQFLQKNRAPVPAYIKRAKDDDKFINAVDPKWSGALPGLFLYDRQGRKVRSFIGETDMAELEAAVRKLL